MNDLKRVIAGLKVLLDNGVITEDEYKKIREAQEE
jgi:hypothetical protein